MGALAATVVLQAVALHTSLAIFLDPAANLPAYGLPARPDRPVEPDHHRGPALGHRPHPRPGPPPPHPRRHPTQPGRHRRPVRRRPPDSPAASARACPAPSSGGRGWTGGPADAARRQPWDAARQRRTVQAVATGWGRTPPTPATATHPHPARARGPGTGRRPPAPAAPAGSPRLAPGQPAAPADQPDESGRVRHPSGPHEPRARRGPPRRGRVHRRPRRPATPPEEDPMSRTVAEEAPVRARIPADLDAPDRIAFGLTVRQAAVLPPRPLRCIWRGSSSPDGCRSRCWPRSRCRSPRPPPWSRSDDATASRWTRGCSPRWSITAPRAAWSPPARRSPRPGPPPSTPHPRKPPTGRGRAGRLGVLRLPASAIGGDGTVTTASATVALVAATTVTSNLNTATEQAAQVAAYARWLNALTGPVQIVISARRLDLGSPRRTHRRPGPRPRLPRPGHGRGRLRLVPARPPRGPRPPRTHHHHRLHQPQPAAAATARPNAAPPRPSDALTAVGVRCRVLDAAEATAVLTAAADPYDHRRDDAAHPTRRRRHRPPPRRPGRRRRLRPRRPTGRR